MCDDEAVPHRSPADWLRDPRARAIRWDTLGALTPLQTVAELNLSWPWLALEIWLIAEGHFAFVPVAAFFFFLTALRQVHGAFHNSIGISPKSTRAFLMLYSGLMLGSLRAIKFNHLRHHRHCLGPDDVEGASARMSAVQALMFGPLSPLLLHRAALAGAPLRERRAIVAELVLNGFVIGAAVVLYLTVASPLLLVHVSLMAVAQCLTAFFAVWTVHHDCDDAIFARTQRGWLKNIVSYNMFYHVEHHLFPNVPQRNLPELARRLDAVMPELTGRRVF